MAQSIKIKLAGTEYPIAVSGPDDERRLRRAADDFNAALARYERRFPTIKLADKLALVGLTEAAGKISAQDEISSATKEAAGLEAEIKSYLEGVDNNR